MKIKHEENLSIFSLPVLQDNIIWILVLGNSAVVVDPSIAKPVETWLREKSLNLEAILLTHHHEDHIGGVKELEKTWPLAKIVASMADKNRIPFQTLSVKDNDSFLIKNKLINTIEIPGHTRSHIAFYIDNSQENPPALFCGDTLFSGGCGRLFEGTPDDMFKSLQKINRLPSSTRIYCGHEYTEMNLKWAHEIKPNDLKISKRLAEISVKRKRGEITLPTTLEIERSTNLFLQAETIEELFFLRNHKDNWTF